MSELTLQRHLHLTNDVMEVPRLTDFINDVCQSLGIEEVLTMQLTLAVEEAAVNVMNYAYEPGTVGTVDLDAEAGNGELKIIIISRPRSVLSADWAFSWSVRLWIT